MARYIGDDLPLIVRLLNKIIIDQVTDCWEFQGAKNNIGYGMMRDGKKMRTTHRVSYEEHSQTKIPAGLVVMHSCDNKCCVNPAHLSVGTHKDNSQDMISKNRHNPWGGCSYGMLGKKQPRTTCPHCNKNEANNVYARYHGDNCKLKPSINTSCAIHQKISP
jgi:hypothetical protein